MVFVDFILVGLLLIGGVRGFKKGIILAVAGFFGFFLALFGAFQLVDWAVALFSNYMELPYLLPALAFIIIFFTIIVGVYLLARIAKAAFHITPFGIFDNLTGALLGVLQWALGISLVFWLFAVLEIEVPLVHFEGSVFFPYITIFASMFVDLIIFIVPYFQELLTSVEEIFKHY